MRAVQQMRWRTMDGRVLTPREMDTRHLYNSLKMIWNNTCDPDHRIYPFKPWRMSAENVQRLWVPAIAPLAAELAKRDDLTPEQEQGLALITRFSLEKRTRRLQS